MDLALYLLILLVVALFISALIMNWQYKKLIKKWSGLALILSIIAFFKNDKS
jgi:uncharacterized membrane protein YoaK (UPF0700 family)